jgi:hypothetical protein
MDRCHNSIVDSGKDDLPTRKIQHRLFDYEKNRKKTPLHPMAERI